MGRMSLAAGWRTGWAGRAERIAAARHGLAATTGLLGLAAVIEALARAAMTHVAVPGTGPSQAAQFSAWGLLYCMLGLATTLPLAFLRPALAAVALTAISLLSLGLFHFLTVAGATAVLVAVYRAGRRGTRRDGDAVGGGVRGDGAQYAALGLTVPFLVLALASGAAAGTETWVLTVVLAALVPAAAWAGIARRAQAEARLHTAATQVIAGELVEHTARGERARIARELHDVVAHHISMIAVQAETARLTTPGLPTAGAERLSEIGDTARAGADGDAAAARRAARGRPGRGGGPASPAWPGTAPRAGRRGQGVLRRGVPADRLRAAGHGRPGRGAGRLPHRPGGAHQRAAARPGRGRRRGSALRRRRTAAGHQGQRAGAGTEGAGGGHGLPGMRERAAAVGGELRAGAATVGGFLVEARLPGQPETSG